MIKSLQIRNYAIIEELMIDFSEGLTIITGETGAGKSILLGALGLIMGKRADTKALYNHDSKCIIEGVFDVSRYGLEAFFAENDLDFETETVVRREITPAGKSRAFVNDTPVNLKFLQQLSGALIDLHQQFDTLDIHNMNFQLRMIDALADNREALQQYQLGFKKYQQDQRTLATLKQRTAEAVRETEFLQFQLNEFDEAALTAGEQVAQEAELKRLSNAEDIKKITAGIYRQMIESDTSVIDQLEEFGKMLAQIADVDPEVGKLEQRFSGLVLEIQDVAEELEKTGDAIEYDPERILEIQQRLDLIYRLQSKHGVQDVDELLEIQEALTNRLQSFDDLSADIARLEKSLTQQKNTLQKQAQLLSKRRKGVTADFERQIHQMLAQLSMQHARLKVQIQPLDELSATGLDEVAFMFAANKGSRMQHIKDVASGGEISRLTLVTKSLVANAIPLPTLIFDEIDSGVSGDVAIKMGDILRKLSDHHQVVSITHSPQIASKADKHFFVYKAIKTDRTVTGVRVLTHEERIQAIATMLSQNPPSTSAIQNARELIEMA